MGWEQFAQEQRDAALYIGYTECKGLVWDKCAAEWPITAAIDDDSSASAGTNEEEVSFRRGDLAVDVQRLGIKVCTGMSVKVIARANKKVEYRNGKESKLKFHSMPDGAAIFPRRSGGYVYVSNSEMKRGLGGVYGLYFDSNGEVVDYKRLLSGTTRNCSGGEMLNICTYCIAFFSTS
jgi:hypothetical protein